MDVQKMADNRAKIDFGDILKSLNKKFEITDTKWVDRKLFEIKFRTQVRVTNDDFHKCCDEWVNFFSQATNTLWIHTISNTGPKVKFRKQYQCWTHANRQIKNELLFDPKKCRGTIDFKILGENSNTKNKNKYLRMGLNVLVKMTFRHLHPVDTTLPFAFFVHRCEPTLSDLPQFVVQTNEKLPELVAKMVENAAVASQKVALRAEELLRKKNNEISSPTVLEVPSLYYPQLSLPEHLKSLNPIVMNNDLQAAAAAAGLSTDGKLLYVQQVLLDSTISNV